MCGIVSLIYKTENPDMGREAEALLRRLEYRGYDSTGASFIDNKRRIVLLKKTGAPSQVCPALGIHTQSGQRFIGQVRWATYGAVTDINSQPHHVDCKIELIGAHNGNISNTDEMKTWLSSRGHAVISDNDGEIIVHLIEEHYASNQTLSSADLAGMRQAYAASGLRDGLPDGVLRMIDAIRKADALAEGSYAAAVADPKLPGVFAVKSGSSLYAGVGSDARGDFIVVSSDLTSVLSKTR
ncbi:MAG TPA: glutamine--fructose-6-phosphate aminotransferase, partial [Spirochaetaceae bacterium]|nr:glutamine--fructose-6-phosphate aminotransferase [Spirochaetaceae bacterium]